MRDAQREKGSGCKYAHYFLVFKHYYLPFIHYGGYTPFGDRDGERRWHAHLLFFFLSFLITLTSDATTGFLSSSPSFILT